MFTLGPIAGLLVIIHLIVNIVVVSFRKMRIYAKKWLGIEFRLSSLDRLTNKEGDTASRRAFAYSIIPVMLAVVVVNGALIVRTSFIDRSIVVKSASMPIANTLGIAQGGKAVTTLSENVPEEKSLIPSRNHSLVDFLDGSGRNSSFNSRAKLAKQFGIVKKVSDYKGTSEQNIKIFYQMMLTPSVAMKP